MSSPAQEKPPKESKKRERDASVDETELTSLGHQVKSPRGRYQQHAGSHTTVDRDVAFPEPERPELQGEFLFPKGMRGDGKPQPDLYARAIKGK